MVEQLCTDAAEFVDNDESFDPFLGITAGQKFVQKKKIKIVDILLAEQARKAT
jgi:hypothetical protein